MTAKKVGEVILKDKLGFARCDIWFEKDRFKNHPKWEGNCDYWAVSGTIKNEKDNRKLDNFSNPFSLFTLGEVFYKENWTIIKNTIKEEVMDLINKDCFMEAI